MYAKRGLTTAVELKVEWSLGALSVPVRLRFHLWVFHAARTS